MTALSASVLIAVSPNAPAAESPLSRGQFAELELANKRAKKIRRAAAVATMDGWLTAIFAGLTLLFGIFSPGSLILGAALAVIAFNSFRGAKRLLQFDAAGPGLLAINQLALAGTLIVYAACALWSASRGNSELSAAANGAGADVAGLLGGYHIDQLVWLISVAMYGGLVLGTLFAQGLTALYYATRRKHLAAYLAATPPWVLELQKAQLPR